MIERLVENWLINAGERGFETPFAQVLAAEEYRIIQGPVHHPFEHGKDILAFAPNDQLCAFQLKGANLTKLEDFEEIQQQLVALAGTAITHPAISPPRRPDRVFLVTSATLSPPVRDRIDKFNVGNVPHGWAAIEPIEREQLLSRFLAAHGSYLPQDLPDIRTLLELYYSDPASQFPVRAFATYLAALLPFPPQAAKPQECRRAIAGVGLLTAYAAAGWTRSDNHFCVAQAWLTACITILRFAAARELDGKLWRKSYELALEAARMAVASLTKEAVEAQDLIVPDLCEGLVYGSRALLVCGLLGAYLLSERTRQDVDEATTDRVRTVLAREAPHIKVVGEASVPSFLTMAAALEQVGEIRTAEGMVLSLVADLAKTNQRHSKRALADPYHEVEQVLLQQTGADSGLGGEEFDGRSYTLHIAIEWLARRLWRQHLAMWWSDITRVEFLEFQPSTPERYLSVDDPDGELRMWWAGQPESWASLLSRARELNIEKLPGILWSQPEMIPYLALLLPYRLTAPLAAAIDFIAERRKG